MLRRTKQGGGATRSSRSRHPTAGGLAEGWRFYAGTMHAGGETSTRNEHSSRHRTARESGKLTFSPVHPPKQRDAFQQVVPYQGRPGQGCQAEPVRRPSSSLNSLSSPSC